MRWFLFNVIGFQAVWWACVLGAGVGAPWAGPLAAVAYAAVHFAFTPTRRRDLRLLAVALVLGLLIDGALGGSGLLSYAGASEYRALAPAWILALWAGFALTLTHSMGWFAARPLAAAAFGLAGGPLAYASANAVAGAVAFPHGSALALAAVGIGWAVALPLLYAMDRRLAGPVEEAFA
jgi:hypothetical protein